MSSQVPGRHPAPPDVEQDEDDGHVQGQVGQVEGLLRHPVRRELGRLQEVRPQGSYLVLTKTKVEEMHFKGLGETLFNVEI